MSKTKGNVVVNAVKLLRSRKNEARKLLDPKLHRYLEERILLTSWYPEDEFYHLLVACAALVPGNGDQWEKLGALTAGEHAENMYADIFKRDPASRASIMWRSQHDTGDMIVTQVNAKSATYELRNWKFASPTYCQVVGGYFTEVHRLTGAAAPKYAHPTCQHKRGDRCVFVINWE